MAGAFLRLEQLLLNLNEMVVANNNSIQLKIKALEKRIEELEKQQLNKTCQESKQKEEAKSADSKIIPKESLEMLNAMPSISQLLDFFLFGSEKEQMTVESLFHKWTINHFDEMQLEKELLSDEFFITEYNRKAQLRLKYLPNGQVYLNFSFEGERSKGEEMDPSLVTVIIKDRSGRSNKRHVLNYEHHFVADANPFYSTDNWMEISKSKLDQLMSPISKSLEVLFMVNPPTVFNELGDINGCLVDTIQFFDEKLQMEHMLSQGHWSPPFLTEPGDSKAIVKIRLDEQSQQLKASIHFFPRGNSPCEINHRVAVRLFHQGEGCKDIVFNKVAKSAADLEINFGNIQELLKKGFVEDGQFGYSVEITPIKKKKVISS